MQKNRNQSKETEIRRSSDFTGNRPDYTRKPLYGAFFIRIIPYHTGKESCDEKIQKICGYCDGSSDDWRNVISGNGNRDLSVLDRFCSAAGDEGSIPGSTVPCGSGSLGNYICFHTCRHASAASGENKYFSYAGIHSAGSGRKRGVCSP